MIHHGSGSWFLPIPNPGSRGQKGTGSRIRNTTSVIKTNPGIQFRNFLSKQSKEQNYEISNCPVISFPDPWYVSGSADQYLWLKDLDPDPARILLFSSGTFTTPTKYNFCLLFWKVHLHHSLKIKSQKEVTKRVESRFTGFAWWWQESDPNPDRTSDLRIREVQKLPDSTDPEHWQATGIFYDYLRVGYLTRNSGRNLFNRAGFLVQEITGKIAILVKGTVVWDWIGPCIALMDSTF